MNFLFVTQGPCPYIVIYIYVCIYIYIYVCMYIYIYIPMWLYSCNDVPAGFLYFKVIYAGWCETASATSTYIIAVALCETVSLHNKYIL